MNRKKLLVMPTSSSWNAWSPATAPFSMGCFLVLFLVTLSFASSAGGAPPPIKPELRPQGGSAEGRLPAGSVTKRALLDLADGTSQVVTYAETPDGQAILDGDIAITVENGRARIARDFERLWSEEQAFGKTTGKSTGIQGSAFRWPNNTVPYVITLPPGIQRTMILDAMQHIEDLTPVRFVPRAAEADFVRYRNFGTNCVSNVGRQGGRQDIDLDTFGCAFGQIVHETLHALGLWHEHQRDDRDDSVIVELDNIDPDFVGQFEKRSGFIRGPFDFASIMNYGSDFFSDNGSPTLTRLDGTTWTANRAAMTAGDATGISDMYKRVRASIQVQCSNGPMRCDFIGSSQDGVQPVTLWRWTIADGNSVVTRTGGAISHFFQNAGTHYVSLEATDTQGDRAQVSTFVTVGSGCTGRFC